MEIYPTKTSQNKSKLSDLDLRLRSLDVSQIPIYSMWPNKTGLIVYNSPINISI